MKWEPFKIFRPSSTPTTSLSENEKKEDIEITITPLIPRQSSQIKGTTFGLKCKNCNLSTPKTQNE